MEVNFLTLAIAAFIPLLVAFIWYGPFLFQKTLMKLLGHSEDPLKKTNLILIFTLSYLFSFSIAFFLQFIVIHQTGVYSSLMEGTSDLTGDRLAYFNDFMSNHGNSFRTFKHGVIHGVLVGVFFILPILAIQAIFERKPIKYVVINAGYWIVSIALIGGVVCQWGF